MVGQSFVRWLRLPLLGVFLVSSLCRAEEAPSASVNLEQIRKAANERQNAIRNIRAEYDVSWKKYLDTPGTRAIALDLDPYHIDFAFDGERRYCERKYDKPKEPDGHRRKNTVVIFDGQTTYKIDSFGVVLIINGKERTCEDGELYCGTTLQLPYRDEVRAALKDGSAYFPYCLNRKELPYRVLPRQEKIDGVWCHVLELGEPVRDRIWVDTEIGCRMRQREQYSLANEQAVISWREHFSDFTKTDANVWVPMKYVCEYFPRPIDPPDFWGKKYMDMTIAVKKVAINHVTDEDFLPTILPGTIVVDENGSFKIEGSKAVLLNQLADVAKSRQTAQPPPSSRTTYFWLLNIAAIAAILTFFLWRYLRSRSKRSYA